MASKDYYNYWLRTTRLLENALRADYLYQRKAEMRDGMKPLRDVIEMIGGVYCQYCNIFNRLCECYDQMTQVQRGPFLKKLIDTMTCRILELKLALQEVETLEYTYTHNAQIKLLMIPNDVEVLCPFFYPFEIRQAEMQYIVDEIMSGNRLGDPTPTPSAIERAEMEKKAEEQRVAFEKAEEIKLKLLLGGEISEEQPEERLTPEEKEARRLQQIHDGHVLKIQSMERYRQCIRGLYHKRNMDDMMYLDLSGAKKPAKSPEIRKNAAVQITRILRRYMELKRNKLKEDKLNYKLGISVPSWKPPSRRIKVENVKEIRRKFRRDYYESWVKKNINERSRIFRLREGNIMDDITDEVRWWFEDWWMQAYAFDEYPWPEEGGSILIVRGETFTVPEWRKWQIEEKKRIADAAANPKTKEQIKQEKAFEKEQRKLERLDKAEREKKFLLGFKKMRLDPEKDPGLLLPIPKYYLPIEEALLNYKVKWSYFDKKNNDQANVLRGYILDFIIEDQFQNINVQLRPIVDEWMRLELALLKKAMKNTYIAWGKEKEMPLTQKRKKPRQHRVKKDKMKRTPAQLFQELVDQGIVRSYPKITFKEFWGDENYAAAYSRSIEQTPYFSEPCVGDAREAVRVRCMLALGAHCPNAQRTCLFVAPKKSGKKTLAYAVATETNSILIDLSPMNVYNKYPGPKKLKKLLANVNKIARLMQPSIILVEDADKVFYKKVPKEEKPFDPSRLKTLLFKEIVKHIKTDDKMMIIGTASEPWVSNIKLMKKAFPNVIMIPRTDYGTIATLFYDALMKYHAVERLFNFHSLAQVVRGYDIDTIKKSIEIVLNPDRIANLSQAPLAPVELLNAILAIGPIPLDNIEYDAFRDWYSKYSPWAVKFQDYQEMLTAQNEAIAKKKKKEKKK